MTTKEQSELEKYKKNMHSNNFLILCTFYTIIYFNINVLCFLFTLDLVVAYKKLTLEKNALEETLKASSNYDKDDVSETDTSEVQKCLIEFVYITFLNFS